MRQGLTKDTPPPREVNTCAKKLPPNQPVSQSTHFTEAEKRAQVPFLYHKQLECERPKLRDTFKELLPLATNWKTIGTLLDIKKSILNKIKADEDAVHDCLQEMLSEWLKQIDPPPTWAALADAVEIVDELKAFEILSLIHI